MKLSCALLAGLAAGPASACSDFYLGDYADKDPSASVQDSEFKLSVRTMDLGGAIWDTWGVTSVPAGQETSGMARVDHGASWVSKYGFLSFGVLDIDEDGTQTMSAEVSDGMNTEGLSCGELTLEGTTYETPGADGKPALSASHMCYWVLGNFATVGEVQRGLADVSVYGNDNSPVHWTVRDAAGDSLVLEVVGGKQRVYLDGNDGGESGYGIMTNEPVWPVQKAMVDHYQWKRATLTRTAIATPGNFYPEERYMRVHMVKTGLLTPSTYQQAVSQAVAVLNTITVPMGEQYGTDSGNGGGHSGEGRSGDHTLWGVVRDHGNQSIYYRTANNPSLRKVDVGAFDLNRGAIPVVINLDDGPWFHDMSPRL